AATPVATTPGEATLGRAQIVYPPARRPPSAEPAVACTLGAPHALGGALRVRSGAFAEDVGRAIHAFFAADRRELDGAARQDLAPPILERSGLAGDIRAPDCAAGGPRFGCGVAAPLARRGFPPGGPLGVPRPAASLVPGTADVVVRSASGV